MKKIFKFFFIALFFSYYFVAIAVNYPWINEHIDPLEKLGQAKFITIDDYIYMGTYPTEKKLKYYKRVLHIQRVITLLDSDFPLSRELIRYERNICKNLGIEYIIIPISYFSSSPMDYMLIKNLISQKQTPTYIHNYIFDKRLQILEYILKTYSSKKFSSGKISK
jgi:hypothetical protein